MVAIVKSTVDNIVLTLSQYHDMIAQGILTPDDPVELLNGWLITKMPKSPRHRVVTKLIRTLLESSLVASYYVDSQEPITLTDSEPEPDVMIIKGKTTDYLHRHPTATEVLLVVEVADSTLKRDRTLKKTLYASHLIPNYWLVNLQDQQLEVYTNHTPNAYERTEISQPSDRLSLIVNEDISYHLAINEILV